MKPLRVTLMPLASVLAIYLLACPGSAFSPSVRPSLTKSKLSPANSRQQIPLFVDVDDNDIKAGEEDTSSGFSLSNMFKGKGGSSSVTAATSPNLRGRGKAMDPHPSVRPHISPLNRLGPDFDPSKVAADSDPLPVHPDVKSGTLPNGFSYVILPNKSPPGRFEAHLQVFSGSCKFWLQCGI